MNNKYIHQWNHLVHNYESISQELFLLEFNFIDLELYVLAHEESYILFQVWIKDEKERKDFITKINENIGKNNSNENYQIAIKASK